MSKPIREPLGSSVLGEPRWEQSYHTGGQHSHHLYQDCREGVAKHQGLEKGSQRMQRVDQVLKEVHLNRKRAFVYGILDCKNNVRNDMEVELCLVFFCTTGTMQCVINKIVKRVSVTMRAFKANMKTFKLIFEAVSDFWRVLESRESYLCCRMMSRCSVMMSGCLDWRRRVLRQRKKLGGFCINPSIWQWGLNLTQGSEKRNEMPRAKNLSMYIRLDETGRYLQMNNGLWLLFWEQR